MTVKAQVKEFLDTSKTKVTDGVKTLEGYWEKTIAPIKERSIKDLLDQFGGLKPTEIIDKFKSSDLGKHWNVVKHEVLIALGVAEATAVKELNTEIEKLNTQLETIQKLKTDIATLKREVTKLKKAQTK